MIVVDTFEQIQHGSNPSLTILAEISCSLNYCRHNKEERFLGCASLLYIWIRSHIPCEGISFKKSHFLGASPIAEFCKNAWLKPKTKEWWTLFFQNSDDEQIHWMAPWMSRPPLLHRCGNLPYVPLIRPWGIISYALLLILRQFGGK